LKNPADKKKKKKKNSWINYELNESDHRLLQIELETSDINFGPGIVRVNSSLLEDVEIKNRVSKFLRSIIAENTVYMNSHERLDYIKMQLRLTLLHEGRIRAQANKNAFEHCNVEISRLKQVIDKELSNHNLIKCKSHNSDCYKMIDYYKEALNIAELKLNTLKNNESKNLIFRSRAKWAEQGEKSNKYFLNLLKERQKKCK
jgi:hypothetical protein